jgi:hypothetical protein
MPANHRCHNPCARNFRGRTLGSLGGKGGGWRCSRRLCGSKFFPLFRSPEDLPQPDNKVGLGIVMLPPPRFIKLDEMGTASFREIAPTLGDLFRRKCCGSILHGWSHEQPPNRLDHILVIRILSKPRNPFPAKLFHHAAQQSPKPRRPVLAQPDNSLRFLPSVHPDSRPARSPPRSCRPSPFCRQ